MTKSLIEEFLPSTEIGIESVRERSASSALPPLYFLHVWFARRPLTTSRAALLGSILPYDADRNQLKKLLGIPPDKDVAKAAELLKDAKSKKIKLRSNPFSWKRAFTYTPNETEFNWLQDQIRNNWNHDKVTILDPMAGGGSIPYESIRLGIDTITGDLNPVAFIILKGTLEYPSVFKEKLLEKVKTFANEIQQKVTKELERFYPKNTNEYVYDYLWCRTVRCQHCNLNIPLSPNWWIVRTDSERIVVKPIVPSNGDTCSFQILKYWEKDGFDPYKGTDESKDARCPRCKTVNNSNYVKAEAQSGRMGHQMYAVRTKSKYGNSMKWSFRPPTEQDVKAASEAEAELNKRLPEWEKTGLIPNEEIPESYFDTRPRQYGMFKWRDFFNPRQLLVHLTYLEKITQAKTELLSQSKKDSEEYKLAEATIVYASLIFDTCINYNCVLTRWAADRTVIKAAMDIQAFPFKSSYAEWNQLDVGAGYDWAVTKTTDALREIIKFLPKEPGRVKVFQADAANMVTLQDKSIDAIVVDPPYADNVMYGELSNFFYVWMKRIVGDLFPDAFKADVVDTREEAVANSSQFTGMKDSAKELADQQYQAKLEACFREMYRVLKDDGIMTVMFTHRKAEAWDNLATALIRAGFIPSASWPVTTEPGEKFGKKEKGVVKTTVLLSCRKRLNEIKGLWEEVKRELMGEARHSVDKYSKMGLDRQDLLVSVYGPVLGKFAEYSIVKDATGELKRPRDALEIVADIVNRFVTADISDIDSLSQVYVNLLRNFPSLVTDYDAARLATVFGGNLSLEALEKGGYVKKEKGKIYILTAQERVTDGTLNVEKPDQLRTTIDVVQAALIVYQKNGLQKVKELTEKTGGTIGDPAFVQTLKAIAFFAINTDASDGLVSEARMASTLLEALGNREWNVMKSKTLVDYE